MPPRTRSQAVKRARKKLHPTDSPHVGAALLQLTHAAPSFLASLSPDALKNLSATSRKLRKQVQASVTSISGVGQYHFHLLVNPQWRLLKVLDLSRTQLNVRGMSLLIQGDWPILTKLDLSCPARPSWAELQLQSLLRQTGQQSPVSTLVTTNWMIMLPNF